MTLTLTPTERLKRAARGCHVHHVCTDHPAPADKWQLPCTCTGRPEESGD